MHRRFAFILFAFFVAPSPLLRAASPETPVVSEVVAEVVGVVRAVRLHASSEEPQDQAGQAKLRARLAEVSGAASMDAFARFALGAVGSADALVLDGFREDLLELGRLLGPEDVRVQAVLDILGFDKFAAALAESMERKLPLAVRNLDSLESVTADLLAAQDGFRAAGAKAERWLWAAHSSLVLSISLGLVFYFQDLVELNQMTPRELITFLGGVWGSNAASYWLAWDYMKWVEPFRKWAARSWYQKLGKSWLAFSNQSPAHTLPILAKAADDKPVLHQRHAGADADAALNALIANKSNDATALLEQSFLSSLEDGLMARADIALAELTNRTSNPKYEALRVALAELTKIRSRMEWKSIRHQLAESSLRVGGLVLVIVAFNVTVRWLAPEHLARWRTVPSALLGAIGGRRLFPTLWAQFSAEALKGRSAEDEQKLESVLAKLLELDPSGDTVARIAVYDSSVAAQQLVTQAAARVLSSTPTAAIAANLWRILAAEFWRNTPSGPRVEFLAQRTLQQTRSCTLHIADAASQLNAAMIGADAKN